MQLYALSGVLDLLPAYAMVARLKVAQGDVEAARQLLPRVGLIHHEAIPQLAYVRAEAERIRLHLLLDPFQPDAARLRATVQEWMAARHLRFDDDLPYAREFEYATLARALLSLNAVEAAHALLQRLIGQSESGQRNGDLMEYLTVDALVLRAQGQREAARSPLQRALTLAEPEGYIRLFVDEGETMRSLRLELRLWILQQPRPEDIEPSLPFLEKLLATFPAQVGEKVAAPSENAKAVSLDLLEPLTARELEALPLLAKGLTNQEIARQLTISPGTAKRHVANIFAKLAVANRTQAVARAREQDLL